MVKKKKKNIYIYISYDRLKDSDRCPVSNRCPHLKSASTDVIISNHGPILGYSQSGVLSKLYGLFIAIKLTSLSLYKVRYIWYTPFIS